MLKQTHHLATGTLVHQRVTEPAHRFVYSMRQLLVDVEALDALCQSTTWWSTKRFALGWFRRQDYLDQPEKSLHSRVREIVFEHCSYAFSGKVLMLSAPRCWGICFNPLTLYFCFDQNNDDPKMVVAEVHNTPWFQRHTYVIDMRDNTSLKHPKSFHVSPFLPMELDYQWQFNLHQEKLRISILNTREGLPVFKASLMLKLQELSAKQLDRELWMHLPQSLKTLAGIYWQALKLIIKRAKFYSHPDNSIKEVS